MKKQIFTKLTLLIVAVFTSVKVSAYDFTVDGIYYNIVSLPDLTCEVTYDDVNHTKYTGDIVIPDHVTYNGRTLTVVEIGESAFYGCSGLMGITIPNSITSIGDWAFINCKGLKNLVIEDGTETLNLGYNYNGEGLFYDCSLETLYLGRNLKYETDYKYGFSPFYSIESLAEVTIGNSVTSLGDYFFEDCSSLEKLIIEDGADVLDLSRKCKLSNCPIKTLYLGRNLLNADQLPGTLTDLTIGNSVTSIGDYAFSGCHGLTSITIPNSVTSIGDWAFFDCHGLTSITIPNSVTSIGYRAFSDCSGLTGITIPNSVTSIGESAFSDCSGLTSITLGSSVAEIGSYVFNECDKLMTIYSLNPTPPTGGSNSFTNQQYIDANVYVPQGSLAAYQAADPWLNFWNIQEIDPTGIDNVSVDKGQFVTIEDGVIKINKQGSQLVSVYTVDGQCVYTGTDNTISNLAKGLYIIRSGRNVSKILIK